ncbi:MAG: hypothetical protein JWR67_2348 [Mucilaginibacter sp.]|nr:hypothetical protein [Mucilaginibacter sp.]
MITTPSNKSISDEIKAHNDDSNVHDDTTGENSGADTGLAKEDKPIEQNKEDEKRVPTVTPGNDSGDPGAPDEDTSNKNEGPAKENL